MLAFPRIKINYKGLAGVVRIKQIADNIFLYINYI